ncbi:MAG: cytochrome c oxidase subunit II [Cyanobacteria bacterium P01_F01_bin.42]
MSRKTIGVLVGLAIVNLIVSLGMGQLSYFWMPPQASAEAVMVDHLFSFMTALGSFIFLGVVGTMLYSVVFQRAAKYDSSDGPPIEGNVTLEVVWTGIPILLVIWIGTVSYQAYQDMGILGPMDHAAHLMGQAIAAPLEPAVEEPPITVMSRQWSWEFRYPGETEVRSTELHLPVNQRAKLKLYSEDVLHGLYVPAFRVKQDIIPGKAIDFEFTPIREGRYRLRDSAFSGTYFASNQTNVVVESEEDFQSWLNDSANSPPAPAENLASQEYERVKNSDAPRWETVKPAPAPLVHHSSSSQDSYE